jgi:tetratricopeptide (TPR) repeat protein
LSWKTLAEQIKNTGDEAYKEFYQKSLDVYEEAIEATNRQNALFTANAATIAKLLGEYGQAEEYYKETIFLSPGNWIHYVNLAELYEYQMGKTKEEIISVYDEGINRVINPAPLQIRKDQFLQRWEEKNE